MSLQKSNAWKYYLALLAGFASLAIFFYLGNHYFQLNLGLSSGPAICILNHTFNCDKVTASKYSVLFGIPIAIWGLATQMILILLTLVFTLNFSSDRSRIGRFTLFLSLFVSLVSLIMGSISLFFLSTYCLFCILTYFLNFLHLALIWNLQEKSPFATIQKDLVAAFTTFKWVGISVLSIVPFTLLFNDMFLEHFGGALLKDTVESSVSAWQSAPLINFSNDGLSKGPSDAKMTIVEFADFLCPHCKHAAPSLKVFKDSHPNVRVIFKAFPLDGSCNASSQMPKGDGTRCVLSKTVFCAEKLAQKGWLFYAEIFERQEEFQASGSASELLKTLTVKNGIDSVTMDNCRKSEETHKNIVAQSQEGLNANIVGTPAIFVNGKLLLRGHLLPVLQKVLDSLESN